MSDRFVEKFKPQPTDVALCGSMAHVSQWSAVAERLQAEGLTVSAPDFSENTDWNSLSDDEAIAKKNYFIEQHLANIAATRTVLVCNYEKNGELGYIGANVMMEMMAAYIYNKPLYLLYNASIEGKGREIAALRPTVLHGDVNKLIEALKEKK